MSETKITDTDLIKEQIYRSKPWEKWRNGVPPRFRPVLPCTSLSHQLVDSPSDRSSFTFSKSTMSNTCLSNDWTERLSQQISPFLCKSIIQCNTPIAQYSRCGHIYSAFSNCPFSKVQKQLATTWHKIAHRRHYFGTGSSDLHESHSFIQAFIKLRFKKSRPT